MEVIKYCTYCGHEKRLRLATMQAFIRFENSTIQLSLSDPQRPETKTHN